MLNKKTTLFRKYFLEINNFTFIVFLFAYLLFLVIEDTTDKFISLFFNYNIFLCIVVVTGLIMLILKENKEEKFKLIKRDYLLIISLACLGFAIAFIKTRELGWLGLVVAVTSGFLTYISFAALLRD